MLGVLTGGDISRPSLSLIAGDTGGKALGFQELERSVSLKPKELSHRQHKD
jgi:hypothetical protein